MVRGLNGTKLKMAHTYCLHIILVLQLIINNQTTFTKINSVNLGSIRLDNHNLYVQSCRFQKTTQALQKKKKKY